MPSEKQSTCCDRCLWREIVVEIRGGKVSEIPACDFGHIFFQRVKEPTRCCDFNPVAAVESD